MVKFESWVERLVREATERGEFDDLPGAGQPIPGLTGRHDDDWWVKAMLKREDVPPPLPPALALRKEARQLQDTLEGIGDEVAAREIIDDLNARIADSHRRRLDGPPIVVGRIDVEEAIAEWRTRRSR